MEHKNHEHLFGSGRYTTGSQLPKPIVELTLCISLPVRWTRIVTQEESMPRLACKCRDTGSSSGHTMLSVVLGVQSSNYQDTREQTWRRAHGEDGIDAYRKRCAGEDFSSSTVRGRDKIKLHFKGPSDGTTRGADYWQTVAAICSTVSILNLQTARSRALKGHGCPSANDNAQRQRQR